MFTDPNPGRAVPMGGRALPADAAGTILLSGLVLSGDDHEAFTRAGYPTMHMQVSCSAKIASGEQAVPRNRGQIVVAIDCNGYDYRVVAGLAGLDEARAAAGVYAGTTSRSVVGYMQPGDITAAHRSLLATLPGFECFAVMVLA